MRGKFRLILRDLQTSHASNGCVQRALIKARTWCRTLAAAFVLAAHFTSSASAQSIPLIRDAEIEGFLRQISKPLFKAADINPGAVKVFVIADDRINAFVSGGQRIFVHTGLLTKTKTPNEVIGVLAHETGHIAGGHLALLGSELNQASAERIIGMLVGAAAVVGGALAGSDGASKVGGAVFAGSGGIAQRNLLSYQRSMEASADQAALVYLKATKQSAAGMLTLFEKLANDSIATLNKADPYLFSHPMPLDRVRTLKQKAQLSPYFGVKDSAGMVLRHDLVKAKIAGYMNSPQKVFQRYPSSNNSMPSRYARAIAMFRRGDIVNALPLIDSLTEELPENPYFWELKAQAYLENAQGEKGLPAITKARKLLPNNGLFLMLHAQILVATEKPESARQAISLLREAKTSEGNTPSIYKSMARAYAILDDVPRAELATAEYAWLIGDKTLALKKAKAAQDRFKKGTPEWLRANDIVTFAAGKKR